MISNRQLTLGAAVIALATSAILAAPISRQPAAPANPPTQDAPAEPAPLTATEQIWLGVSEQLHGDGGHGDGARAPGGPDPMKAISSGMADIVHDLDAELTGKPVQVKQAKVISQLDVLIKELEKSCSGSGNGPGGANPSKPAADSTLAKGPGGMNELHDPKAGEKQWGALKPKEREQILQSTTEGFPQGYESLLQTYYRRLANEETVTPSSTETPSAESTPSPAPAGGASQP